MSFVIRQIVHSERADRPTYRADRREDLQARGRIVYDSDQVTGIHSNVLSHFVKSQDSLAQTMESISQIGKLYTCRSYMMYKGFLYLVPHSTGLHFLIKVFWRGQVKFYPYKKKKRFSHDEGERGALKLSFEVVLMWGTSRTKVLAILMGGRGGGVQSFHPFKKEGHEKFDPISKGVGWGRKTFQKRDFPIM